MKLRYTLIVFLLAGFIINASWLQAQDCNYTLELFDTFGDGWNGASIDVTIGGETTNYTLLDEFPGGSYASFTIPVVEGSEISISFTSGSYDNELSFTLFDPNGSAVFHSDPYPPVGEIFTGVLGCPSCSPTNSSSIHTENIRAYSTQIFWEPLLSAGSTYLIEYDTLGFTQGMGTRISTTSSPFTLTSLQADTDYEYYLSGICEDGDTVMIPSSFSFRTMIPLDLGIVGISRPVSGCGLSYVDTITVEIHNFAGAPQSLIPFNFMVNGELGGVNHPIDGVYTGVLGTDSTDMMDFDMGFDFSEPGAYEIVAWTEMEGDTIPQNDTFSITIINSPIISELPYFSNFEGDAFGGWGVMPESENSTLELGVPSTGIISAAASGQNAWVTNLTGNYQNSERSYLGSPCLDFSNVSEDPIIDFSFIVATEQNYDALWLEVSRDGGIIWEKLGEIEPNWYDIDSYSHGPSWSGTGNTSWRVASHVLTNTAGNPEVRLRFVFFSDGSVIQEGIGIDNIYIHGNINDLSVFGGTVVEDDLCGGESIPVSISFYNHGNTSQSGFDAHYQLNEEPVVIENVGGLTISPQGSASFTFAAGINTLNLPEYTLKIWATFNDENAANDTTTLVVSKVKKLPVVETFDESVPTDWISSFNWYTANAHNNLSANLGANIYDFNLNASFQTPYFGAVAAGDSLSFEYRYSLYSDPATAYDLVDGDFVEVQIAPFCTTDYETVMTINSDNHVSSAENTRVAIDLSPYLGESISVRMNAFGGGSGSDVWLDIDNFIVGNAINTAVEEAEEVVKSFAVMPNPTSGLLTIQFDLLDQTDVDFMLTNLLGKRIYQQSLTRVQRGETVLDLSAYPDGIYYLSLVASGQLKTVKVMKVN